MKFLPGKFRYWGVCSLAAFGLWVLPGCSAGPALASAPPPVTATPVPAPTSAPREVSLTLGAWRTDDVEQMNRILEAFNKSHPHITVKFDPTQPAQYDAALLSQLKSGAAPDVFYLRSYSVSRSLFEQGYLAPLDDLPGLKENFSPESMAPWATATGQSYGVPYIATSHAIYYNVDMFDQLGLTPPATWEELLTAAETIRAAGFIPFANASGDSWTMAELVFMNLAPNFVGGRAGRMAYLAGERCFNNAEITAVFQAIKDMAPYLPPNQQLLGYADSQQLFLQGQAAMFLDGSWDIPFFEAQNPAFTWGIFAPPPPAGLPPQITFHLDAGVGLNAAGKHQAEARQLLSWLTGLESAQLMGNQLPGFFPMQTNAPVLENQHANAFLALNQNRGIDVRFAWEQLRDGSPDGYTLIMDGALAVVNGRQSPQAAANALQTGLAQWFEPAQRCQK